MSEKVRSSIEIEASPDEVWEVVMDPNRLGDWVSAHRELHRDGKGELAEGETFAQTLRLGGAKTRIEWTIVDMEKPRSAYWRGRGPIRSKAYVTYDLTPDGSGTRFDYCNSFDLPGGPVGRLAARVASASKGKAEAEKSLATLKSILENGS